MVCEGPLESHALTRVTDQARSPDGASLAPGCEPFKANPWDIYYDTEHPLNLGISATRLRTKRPNRCLR